MKKSICLAILIFVTLNVSGQNEDELPNLEPQTVLTRLFDSKNFDKETQEVLWSPNTFEKVNNSSIVSVSDGFCHTKIDTILYVSTAVKDYKSNQAVVIFRTGDIAVCHACTGVHGVATFEKYGKDKVWRLRTFEKMLIETGGYGVGGDFEMKNFGKDESGSDTNCLLYHQPDYGNFGVSTGYNYLFFLNDYKQVLRYKYYDTNEGSGVENLFTDRTEMTIVKTAGISKIELVTKRSKKDIIKSTTKRLFEYSDELGVFVPVCAK